MRREHLLLLRHRDIGSKTLLFLSPQDADAVGSGIVNLADVLERVTPLQTNNGITAKDAASSDIQIKLKEDTEFAVFGFLSDGQGKDLNLDRSVMAPLPDAANCLSGAAASSNNDDPVTVIPPAQVTLTTSTTSNGKSVTLHPITPSSSGFVKTVKVTSILDVTSTSMSTVPTTPPAATATSLSWSSSSSAASAAPLQRQSSVQTIFFLGKETGSDGSVLPRNVIGGHVRGSLTATILPFGSILFGLSNTTFSNSSAPEQTLVQLRTRLLCRPQSMGGSVAFAMTQTPLSTNCHTDALMLSFQNASSGGSAFGNGTTILGKATSINSTMFRIDAFTVEAPPTASQ